jgi:hypothetical protein
MMASTIEGSKTMISFGRWKLAAATVAGVAVVAAGGAVAADQLSPAERSKAVVADAAQQLGVKESALTDALEKAYENQIDADVASGAITQSQGDALKAKIEAGDFPLVGGFGPGMGRHGGHGGGPGLDAAASYLGLTEAELRTQLDAGKTLADVAKAQGKTVDGLVAALVSSAKTRVAADVQAGRLTQAQADATTADLQARITEIVNSTHAGHGGHDGPPPAPAAASSATA